LKNEPALTFRSSRLAARLAALEVELLAFITPYPSDLHGLPHLREVSLLAGFLADAEGQDVERAMVAGFLHDCERRDDGADPRHGERSATKACLLAPRLFPYLDAAAIARAIKLHAGGITTQDDPDAVLWDADRLTLVRLGYRVDPRRLSTSCAKRLVKVGAVDVLREHAAAAVQGV